MAAKECTRASSDNMVAVPDVGLEGLGVQRSHVVTTQIVRVLGAIVQRRPDLERDEWSSDAIVEAYRSYGLVPESLTFPEDEDRRNRDITEAFEALSDVLPCKDAVCARVCFAAAIYPQRIWQLPGRFAELMQRIRAFQEFAIAHDRSRPVRDFLCAHLKRIFPDADLKADQVEALVRDIAGGADVTEPAFDGAALYLTSCHPPLLSRIVRFWRDDAQLVRAVRKYFSSPPSWLGAQPGPRENARGDRNDIAAAVRAAVGEEAWVKVQAIERSSWGVARKWPAAFPRWECIQEAWEDLWEHKARAGFPYYSFRSHFKTWWLQEIGHYRFDLFHDEFHSDDIAEAVDTSRPPPAQYSSLPSIDELRNFREGYRLVRTSFFSRDNEGTDELRQGIDALWHFHLKRKLFEEEKVEWGALKTLVQHLDALQVGNVSKLLPAYNKLRMRMWAYVQARTTSRSNAEILHSQRPVGYRDSGQPFPLAGATGTEMIASLARVAHRDHSLLWIFMANVLLRERLALNPRYVADHWGIAELVTELWHWVTDPLFEPTVAYGASPPDEDEQQPIRRHGEPERRQGNADRVALNTMGKQPVKGLIETLVDMHDEAEVGEFVDQQPLDDLETTLKQVLKKEWGELILAVPAKRRRWRQTLGWPGKVATHWVIPVWFLTVVERLSPEETVAQLKVDEHERPAVRLLARQWRDLWDTESTNG